MSDVRIHVISSEDLRTVADLLVNQYSAIDVVIRGPLGIVSATVPTSAVDLIRGELSIDGVSVDQVRSISGGVP